MKNLTPIQPLNTSNPSLSPASANWGKVYQKYISTNLSSEQLARGAYDAYNLLSAGNLSTFQGNAVSAINTLISNQTKLSTDLTKTVSNLDSLFSTKSGDSDSSISEGDVVGSKFYLSFPSKDDGTTATVYNLSDTVRLPFARKTEVGEYCPGLIKGFSADKLDKIIPLFNTATNESGFFASEYSHPDAPTDATYKQPIELLVWEINNLQNQIRQLRNTINEIANGRTTLEHLSVKFITFADITASQPGYTPVAPTFQEYYIKPGQFQTDVSK